MAATDTPTPLTDAARLARDTQPGTPEYYAAIRDRLRLVGRAFSKSTVAFPDSMPQAELDAVLALSDEDLESGEALYPFAATFGLDLMWLCCGDTEALIHRARLGQERSEKLSAEFQAGGGVVDDAQEDAEISDEEATALINLPFEALDTSAAQEIDLWRQNVKAAQLGLALLEYDDTALVQRLEATLGHEALAANDFEKDADALLDSLDAAAAFLKGMADLVSKAHLRALMCIDRITVQRAAAGADRRSARGAGATKVRFSGQRPRATQRDPSPRDGAQPTPCLIGRVGAGTLNAQRSKYEMPTGDQRMDVKTITLAAALAIASASAASALPVTIGFDNGSALSNLYQEDGFDVAGNELLGGTFGTPLPSILLDDITTSLTVSNALGVPFDLVSFDHLCLVRDTGVSIGMQR